MKLAKSVRVLASVAALVLATACNNCCPRRTCCPAPCPPKPCGPSPCAKPGAAPGTVVMPMPAPTPAAKPAPAAPSAAAPAPAAAVPAAPAEGAKKSLFERLGGLPAISAVTDDFFDRITQNKVILANPAVADSLAKADVANFKKLVVEQICEATGGPCKYSGRSMKESHKGMNITDAEWDTTVADFVASLDKFNVPAAEKAELLNALGSMKGDIVGQ